MAMTESAVRQDTGETRADVRRAGADGPGGSALDRAALAERIAAAATAVAGVAGVTAGPRARLVTYRVGEPVAGVAVRPAEVEIGVVAEYGRVLHDLADDVRAAVRPLAEGRPVHVLIADVAEGDG